MFKLIPRWSLLALAVLGLAADRAKALSEILSETKEQLKLKYEVSVRDLGNGRVFVTFTLADEGRLNPLTSVDLQIPGKEKNKDGSVYPDVWVSIAMTKTEAAAQSGGRVARLEMTKELAGRAEIWLMTRHLDGKQEPETGYVHVVPIEKYINNPPPAAAPAAPAGPASCAPAPPASPAPADSEKK